jgi:hypothetical protein
VPIIGWLCGKKKKKPKPKLVLKAQPDISQLRSGWLPYKEEFRPERTAEPGHRATLSGRRNASSSSLQSTPIRHNPHKSKPVQRPAVD